MEFRKPSNARVYIYTHTPICLLSNVSLCSIEISIKPHRSVLSGHRTYERALFRLCVEMLAQSTKTEIARLISFLVEVQRI